MRRYEIMVIVTDTIEEADAVAVGDRVKTIIANQDGKLLDDAWWGKREFTFEINKRHHGFYAVYDVEMTDEGLREAERLMKLNDHIIRFKTIRPHVRVRQFA